MLSNHKIVRTILILFAVVFVIWGVGWTLFDLLKLWQSIKTAMFQNIMYIIVGATWLILLLRYLEQPDQPQETQSQEKESTGIIRNHLRPVTNDQNGFNFNQFERQIIPEINEPQEPSYAKSMIDRYEKELKGDKG